MTSSAARPRDQQLVCFWYRGEFKYKPMPSSYDEALNEARNAFQLDFSISIKSGKLQITEENWDDASGQAAALNKILNLYIERTV